VKKSHALFIALWVGVISLVVGYIHSWHIIDLKPNKNLSLAFNEMIPEVTEEFGVIHFLTPLCSCSEQIFKHLIERGPLNKEKEVVILINDAKEIFATSLKERGFQVNLISTDKLSEDFKNAVQGVPLLVIYEGEKKVRYAGGYYEKAITPFTKIDIEKFTNSLRSGRDIASLPIVGCAVSEEYKKILDPFGLKYQEI